MKVYVVTWNVDTYTSVSKVFDSEEKAKEFCKKRSPDSFSAYYSYEEMDVE